jgi:hypothetical protein
MPDTPPVQARTALAKVTCARDNLRGQKSLGPLKMSLEMAHKVIVPQKKLYPAVILVQIPINLSDILTFIFLVNNLAALKSSLDSDE